MATKPETPQSHIDTAENLLDLAKSAQELRDTALRNLEHYFQNVLGIDIENRLDDLDGDILGLQIDDLLGEADENEDE